MTFSYWPRLQIQSHNAKVSLESVSANFTGFGSDAIDQKTSATLSSGGPKWVENNQEVINKELTRVVVKYINNILRRRGNLVRIIYAMIFYDDSRECVQTYL